MRSPDTDLQNRSELRATPSEIAAPKTDISVPKQKNMEHFWGILTGKSVAPNGESLLKNHYRNLHAATTMQFNDVQLQKTLVLRMQPRQKQPWRSHKKNRSAARDPQQYKITHTHKQLHVAEDQGRTDCALKQSKLQLLRAEKTEKILLRVLPS